MTYSEARTSKLRKGFAVAQASILMLSLFAIIVPADVFAATVIITPTTSNLVVKKVIVGGTATANSFSFIYDKQGVVGPVTQQFDADGQNDLIVAVGAYDVSEVASAGYTATYASNQQGHLNDCNNLSAGSDQDVTQHGPVICTITNTYTAPTPPQVCTLVSDATTQQGGHDSVPVPLPLHSAWTAAIPGATWIWGELLSDADAQTDKTESFTKSFTLTGTASATLDIASDNGYKVTVNGTVVDDQTASPPVEAFSTVHSVPTAALNAALHAGSNTLLIEVTNSGAGHPEYTALSNPAGLLYKLVVTAPTCGSITPPQGSLTGHVIIKKHVDNSGGGIASATDFNLHIMTTGGLPVDVAGSPNVGSEIGVAYDLLAGDYTVSEDSGVNYQATFSTFCAGGHFHVDAGGTSECVVTNTFVPSVTVIATKIVCDNEADLPDANGSPHMTGPATASTFLASHPTCHAVPGWQFEWADQTGGDAGNAFTGPAGAPYHTSGATAVDGTVSMTVPLLPGLSEIHIREVLKPGFIPFTFDPASSTPNGNTVTAELSCYDDGFNYDNLDFIHLYGSPAGNTYHCVAWNVAEKGATSDVTMCKTDDTLAHTPLSGWNLFLKGDHVQDFGVGSSILAGTNSNPLTSGLSYLALASGVWTNQGGANPADAEYSTTNGWATHVDGYTGFSNDILETEINSTDGNWGPYNSAHEYAQSFVSASNAPSLFGIFDGTGGVQNPGWFADNSGSIFIGLFKGHAGITGQNGCVTFKNVPYGTYIAGETAQDGWTTVSGTGSVVVDSPTETFTIVNHEVTGGGNGGGGGTTDLCSNVPGVQTSTAGYTVVGTICTPIVVDVCPNLPNAQATVPTDYVLNTDTGDCDFIGGVGGGGGIISPASNGGGGGSSRKTNGTNGIGGGAGTPPGKVLGAETEAIPLGAPNTGAGGMADATTSVAPLVTLIGLALVAFAARKNA